MRSKQGVQSVRRHARHNRTPNSPFREIRYMDILPNPKTRVPLPVINSDPRTEYVNANYVRGPSGNPKHYICAMGPKPTTVDQYWRMLWQEKPLAIVMITGIVEKGQPKCERYWPGLADGKTIMSFDENRIRIVTTKVSFYTATAQAIPMLTRICSTVGPVPGGLRAIDYQSCWAKCQGRA